MIKSLNNLSNSEKDDLKNHLFLSSIKVLEVIKGTHIRLLFNRTINQWEITRPGEQGINFIDRTLMTFYDDIFLHFSSINTEELDKNLIYCFRYNHEQEIIFLTHLIDKDLNEVFNFNILQEHAKLLNVSTPEVLYNRKLNKEEIEEFISLLDKNELSNFFNLEVDSIVIKLFEVNRTYLYFESKNENNRENKNNDYYYITLIDFNNFIKNEDIHYINIKGYTKEERYLYLICKLFNKFIEKNRNRYQDLEFDKPEFLNQRTFSINKKLIPNLKTQRLIENETFKDIFKIVLNGYRKTKKYSNSFFDEIKLQEFNTHVKKINNYLTHTLVNEENVAEQFTFLNYYKSNLCINWKSDFSHFTKNDLLAAKRIYKKTNKRVRLVLEKESYQKQEQLLELVNEYYFIFDVINDETCEAITDQQVEEITGIKINRQTNLENKSLSEIKDIVPRPLHKFY